MNVPTQSHMHIQPLVLARTFPGVLLSLAFPLNINKLVIALPLFSQPVCRLFEASSCFFFSACEKHIFAFSVAFIFVYTFALIHTFLFRLDLLLLSAHHAQRAACKRCHPSSAASPHALFHSFGRALVFIVPSCRLVRC